MCEWKMYVVKNRQELLDQGETRIDAYLDPAAIYALTMWFSPADCWAWHSGLTNS